MLNGELAKEAIKHGLCEIRLSTYMLPGCNAIFTVDQFYNTEYIKVSGVFPLDFAEYMYNLILQKRMSDWIVNNSYNQTMIDPKKEIKSSTFNFYSMFDYSKRTGERIDNTMKLFEKEALENDPDTCYCSDFAIKDIKALEWFVSCLKEYYAEDIKIKELNKQKKK